MWTSLLLVRSGTKDRIEKPTGNSCPALIVKPDISSSIVVVVLTVTLTMTGLDVAGKSAKE